MRTVQVRLRGLFRKLGVCIKKFANEHRILFHNSFMLINNFVDNIMVSIQTRLPPLSVLLCCPLSLFSSVVPSLNPPLLSPFSIFLWSSPSLFMVSFSLEQNKRKSFLSPIPVEPFYLFWSPPLVLISLTNSWLVIKFVFIINFDILCFTCLRFACFLVTLFFSFEKDCKKISSVT